MGSSVRLAATSFWANALRATLVAVPFLAIAARSVADFPADFFMDVRVERPQADYLAAAAFSAVAALLRAIWMTLIGL